MIAGRYSLDREIGRGGSGAVWLGRDEVLGRPVALKRIGLLPGADQTDLERAEREARLSARLNHPHVVAVFDVVVEADAHWLVMEYVDGVTLGQYVRAAGGLSPDAAAPLLAQTADALTAAHDAGISHRDVKPSNVMVDRALQVKLTDFGIARITSDATLTQTGMVTGSPAYLAPEVATGGRGGEAGDVWSLGATAFYVLAGRPPYDTGDHVLSTLYRIVNDDPPRLAEAGWMAPLLAGTMVKDPTRRWSMRQVRDFLTDPRSRDLPSEESTQVLGAVPLASQAPAPTEAPTGAPAPKPVQPPPSPPRETTARRSPDRRRTILWLAAGAVIVALALGAGLFGLLSGDNDNSASRDPETPSTPSATPSETAAQPTSEGIEQFIRDYVAAVADDPATSWQMLTPKFQEESGGFDTYRAFWEDATNGRVLSISTNPDDLTVSYQVRFDNFKNGPGPTVLDLTFDDGRYLIDGERTEGFTPSG